MNKCILCTFLGMIWDGLWHNTCPSVDKGAEEKKVSVPRVSKEFFAGIVIVTLVASCGYLLLYLVAQNT